MNHQAIGDEMVQVCRWMAQRGFVAADDGAMSVRLSGEHILITPRERSWNWLSPAELVQTDLGGHKVDGKLDPSLSIRLHLAAYRQRPEMGSVIQAQPPAATAFALCGIPLVQPALPETILTLGSIPLATYAAPGTEEAARAIENLIKEHDALLLKNRGLLTIGLDPRDALNKLERVEQLASVLLRAKSLGHVDLLPGTEVTKLMELRNRWQLGGKHPLGSDEGESQDG